MKTLATIHFAEMHDADQLDQLLGNWRIDSMQLDKGELEVVSEQIVFPDVVIERSRQNLAKRDQYQIPSDSTLFCLFKPGSAAGHWCGLEIPENVMLVNQSGRDHFAVLPAGYEHISISIANDLVVAWDLLPHAFVESTNVSGRSVIPLIDHQANAFRRWLFNLFEARQRLEALTSVQEQAELFQERLRGGLDLLLDRGFAMQGTQPRRVRSTHRFPTVRRACTMLNERITETVPTSQLATELGVNLRTLQRGFADVFGMTPYQYVQLRKLQAARRELRQTSQTATTVSQVAIKYGFTELGRFSVRYRQMFGELPSDTLKAGTRMFSTSAVNRYGTQQ